jgi:hypothetical protein
MTPGTFASIAANLLIALFGAAQGLDWVHILGNAPSVGWSVTAVAILNGILHKTTGT